MASAHQLRLLGQRLKSAREAQGLSQEALGAAVGYGRTSIANIEAGRQNPPLMKLIALAQVLDVPLSALVTGEAPVMAPGQQLALYARAWHADATAALDRQIELLRQWAEGQGAEVVEVVREVVDPLDVPRQLLRLVTESRVPAIVVCNKDQLGWFNVPFVEAILQTQGRQLIDLGVDVISATETWSALCHVRDLFSGLLQTLHARLPTEAEPALPPPLEPELPLPGAP
jgi:transcriptional regulator with XRE-family HTH domain